MTTNPIFIGIDVGGTFTDFVVFQDGALRIHKAPTTPGDQSQAILQGLRDLGLLDAPKDAPKADLSSLAIVHGMTVATNALLERRGARTALLTTRGFADVLAIGRQNRPELYRLHQERPEPLAPDGLRFEVAERIDADGRVLTALDEEALRALAPALARSGAQSLAIVFLFAYRNPQHERRAAAILHELLPDLPLSLSSDILPEYREYERTAATVINACVQPLVAAYLRRLEQALAPVSLAALRIMQSNGGVIDLPAAAAHAARLVLSGPAGGVVGAFALAQAAQAEQAHAVLSAPVPTDAPHLLTFDMGGTSTDVCLCPGQIPTTAESSVGGLPLRLPMIDIHTVGAGGGSIAAVDSGGGLTVGPHSAGALPGPACYGLGGSEPTVTDANLLLGRLDPHGFGGREPGREPDGFLPESTGEAQDGGLRLDLTAARRALEALGRPLGLSAEEAALGVLRIANAAMERALRAVSVEKGYDPRGFTLFPFGGAGPLHACDLADALAIPRILCPAIPGVLSAYGMLAADLSVEHAQSVLSPLAALSADPSPLDAALAQLETQARRTLGIAAPAPAPAPRVAAFLDLRYRGQSYELSVPLDLPAGEESLVHAAAAFHAAHAQRYGYAMADQALEAVTLRLRLSLPGTPVSLPFITQAPDPGPPAYEALRSIWLGPEGQTPTPLYRRSALLAGHRLVGPALILQYDSTMLLGRGWTAAVDAFGNLWCEKGESHG